MQCNRSESTIVLEQEIQSLIDNVPIEFGKTIDLSTLSQFGTIKTALENHIDVFFAGNFKNQATAAQYQVSANTVNSTLFKINTDLESLANTEILELANAVFSANQLGCLLNLDNFIVATADRNRLAHLSVSREEQQVAFVRRMRKSISKEDFDRIGLYVDLVLKLPESRMREELQFWSSFAEVGISSCFNGAQGEACRRNLIDVIAATRNGSLDEDWIEFKCFAVLRHNQELILTNICSSYL